MGFSLKNLFFSKNTNTENEIIKEDNSLHFVVKAAGDEYDKKQINKVVQQLPFLFFDCENDFYILPIVTESEFEEIGTTEHDFNLEYWYKKPGEYINKGDFICVLSLDLYECFIHVQANIEGYLDPNIRCSNRYIENDLHSCDSIYYSVGHEHEDFDPEIDYRVFSIYDEEQYQIKQKEVLSKKLQILVSNEKDDFSKKNNIFCTMHYGMPLITDKIIWNKIDYINPEQTIYNHDWGFIILENYTDFYFEFYVLCEEGISYLTLLFPETNNSLKKGTVVNFLFDNDTVLSYEIDKVNKLRFDNDNKIYNLEAKVKLRDFDTKTFAENRIVKWRITTENSLREGSITNEESQKNVMQLFNFYRNTYNETVGLNTLENYTETKKPEKCFVYLMHDTSNDMHKIGVSNSPDYREKTLQSEKPTIELLSSKPFVNRKIAMILEKSLHENYSENRIRGEWFDLTTIQINEIKEMLS